jgi:hypothetical protein
MGPVTPQKYRLLLNARPHKPHGAPRTLDNKSPCERALEETRMSRKTLSRRATTQTREVGTRKVGEGGKDCVDVVSFDVRRTLGTPFISRLLDVSKL